MVKQPAEVDPWNFASHVRIPVLMLNGRDDFTNPLEVSYLPLFRLLGTPDKKHVLHDGGHVNRYSTGTHQRGSGLARSLLGISPDTLIAAAYRGQTVSKLT